MEIPDNSLYSSKRWLEDGYSTRLSNCKSYRSSDLNLSNVPEGSDG
jgi:hypothetical protein